MVEKENMVAVICRPRRFSATQEYLKCKLWLMRRRITLAQTILLPKNKASKIIINAYSPLFHSKEKFKKINLVEYKILNVK